MKKKTETKTNFMKKKIETVFNNIKNGLFNTPWVTVAGVVIILVVTYLFLIYSYVTFQFYYWFIPLEVLSYRFDFIEIMGLRLFISVLTYQQVISKVAFIKEELYRKENFEKWLWVTTFVKPLVILFVGWMVKNRLFFL